MRLNIFKRNKEENTVAPELQQYYEAEKKERAGLSWLLAVVSVAFVSLVLIGMFFGGRWVYDRMTKDDEATTETTQVNEDLGEQAPATPDQPAQATPVEEQPAATPTPTPAPAATSTPAPSTTPAANPPAPSAAQVPVTGDSSLPSTGPAENMLAIFLATTILFALVHNFYSRQTK